MSPSSLAPLALIGLLAAAPSTAQITVPTGFEVDVYADGLSNVTGLAFDGDGVLHVSDLSFLTGSGRVLRLEDGDGDGRAETVIEHAIDLGLTTGISFRGVGFPLPPRPPACASSASSRPPSTDLERIRRGAFGGQRLDLFASHFRSGVGGGGTISRLRDLDGDGIADQRDDIVTDLPSEGHNGNLQIAVGHDGRLYFGQGGRTDAGVPVGGPPDGPLNGTILAVQPDGADLAVHARGLRAAFNLLFTPEGHLYATENGPDSAPVADPPDELNAIREGGDYGWPDHYGYPPIGSGHLGPIAEFGASTSTDGIALVTPETWCGLEGEIIAAQFGSFSDTTIGRRLIRIRLLEPRGTQVVAFAEGFGRPLDVAFGPDDALYVADFSDTSLSAGSAVIYRIHPSDSDGDGTPDICDAGPTALGPRLGRVPGRPIHGRP